MKMNILRNNTIVNISKYVFFALLLIFATFVYWYANNLGNGYEYKGNRSDNYHIRKNGQIIVKSTIVDFHKIGNYVVGLRLPAQYLECDGGAGYKIRLINKKEYFILSIKNGEVLNYASKEKFEAKLDHLEIKKRVSLSYSNFDTIWKQYSEYYQNIDYSNCIQKEDLSIVPE